MQQHHHVTIDREQYPRDFVFQARAHFRNVTVEVSH